MLRACLERFRSTTAVIAAVMFVAAPAGAAWAQTTEPQPVIEAAPARVDFGRDAGILGRIEGGTPGQEVELERWRTGDWRRIATKVTNPNNRVRFQLVDLKRSAPYRLVLRDPATGDVSRSKPTRIAVTPRLELKISKEHVYEGRRLRIYGSLFPKVRGREVRIQQRVDGAWRGIDQLKAGDGWFSTYFRPGDNGYRRVRVKFAGDGSNTPATAKDAVRVYEPEEATWYGPGLYGNRTACGQRLGYETLGVAHRSLPCGTDVSILYEGRTITVPVIDRGPYTSADWDLTGETARRLRFEGRDTIGIDRR